MDLRNQIYPWITKVAAVLAAGRPSERIFEYRNEEFTKEFRRATGALGLKNIVPYQCRHSGASLDNAGQHRTMLEIKNGQGGSQTTALPDTKNLENWHRSSPISTKVT